MNQVKRVVLFATISSFLILVLLLILIVSIGILWGQNTSFDEPQVYDYQIYEVNPWSNHTASGFVTTGRQIETFESYLDDYGTFVLISQFGDDEYSCLGSCYCLEESNERRTSGALMTRGLIYLVAAVSSALAYELAKEHYVEECETRFSDTCEKSSIVSNVEKCALFTKKKTTEEQDFSREPDYYVINDEAIVNKVDENGEDIREYWCEGTCIKVGEGNMKFDNNPEFAEKMRNFDCSVFEAENQVVMVATPQKYKNRIQPEATSRKRARIRFMKETLKSYCRAVSILETTLVYKESVFGTRRLKAKRPACRGYRVSYYSYKGLENETVFCRRHEYDELNLDIDMENYEPPMHPKLRKKLRRKKQLQERGLLPKDDDDDNE